MSIINDSSYYYINLKQNTNDIYRTNDYGITFFPTELGLDTTLFYNTHQDSAGAKIDTLSVSIDTVSYFGKFDHTNIFYMNTISYGKTN